MKRVKVTPHVSQTSSKTGALVLVLFVVGLSVTTENNRDVEAVLRVNAGLNAAEGEMANANARMESFILRVWCM